MRPKIQTHDETDAVVKEEDTEDSDSTNRGGIGGGVSGGGYDPASSSSPSSSIEDSIDAQNPPPRMGGFSLVTPTDAESWKDLLECAETFFQPRVGCSCKSCDKRKTRDQLAEAIQTMKQSALGERMCTY